MNKIILLFTIAFLLLTGSLSFSQSSTELNIVSWNVFLRPSILNDGQLERVDSIAEYLLNTNADVLVLQEVFHKRAKKRLTHLLNKEYKFNSKMGRKSFWGVSSGVLIFSKHKIIEETQISFKDATGNDKMACKGGVSTIIDFFNSRIQIIGTHLQAGNGIKRIRIRRRQLKQLKTLENDSVEAAIYVGDFNISKSTEDYQSMLQTLECSNNEVTGEVNSTSNFNDQDLFPTSGKAKWIDFILLKINDKVRFKKSHIEEPKSRFRGLLSRLSDHNPIHSSMIIEEPSNN